MKLYFSPISISINFFLCYDVELHEYSIIICMDEGEHKPMVLANSKLQNDFFEYWDIIDEPKMKSEISLPKCYRKVESLFKDLEA